MSGELSRRPDGRWTRTRRSAEVVGAVAPDPATTELAVTRARGTRTDAEWDAVNEHDPAFEKASSRFFETDQSNRMTYEHPVVGEGGAVDGLAVDPRTDPGLAGPEDRRHLDQDPGAKGNGHGPFDHDDAFVDGYEPDRSTSPGVPVGQGYEAIYGEAVVDATEPDVDEDELATGAAARRNAIEWAVVLVAAVLLALVLRALVLQAFYIPSPSMEDTLLIQDRVLVNKLSYRFGDVGRGDIVVFHRTEDEITSAGPNQPKDVIKRVIALSGETIEIRENTVLIDDDVLIEPYLEPGLVMPDFGPLTVPEGFLFVMGDNRNLSSDSRGELGPIAEDRVVGRAFVLFWPVDRVTRL